MHPPLVFAPRPHRPDAAAPSPTALPRPGDLVGGKYSLVRKVGEGGMAVVFEARHVRLRQRVAIKVLRPDVCDFDLLRARFEREARATARLKTPHAARVIDVGKSNMLFGPMRSRCSKNSTLLPSRSRLAMISLRST